MIRGRYYPIYIADDERGFMDECAELLKKHAEVYELTVGTSEHGLYQHFAYQPCPARWSASRQLPGFIKSISEEFSLPERMRNDHGTKVNGMDLSGESISNVDFTPLKHLKGAVFTNAQFTNCTFSKMNLTQLMAKGAVFRNCDFSAAIIRRADFAGAQFIRCKFNRASMVHNNFDCASFNEGHYHKTTERLSGMTLGNCSFKGAVFERAAFVRCHFDNDLIDFAGATMKRAEFLGCTVGSGQVRINVTGLTLVDPINIKLFTEHPYNVLGSGSLSLKVVRARNEPQPEFTIIEEWRTKLYKVLTKEHEYAINCALSEDEDNAVIQSMRGLYNV